MSTAPERRFRWLVEHAIAVSTIPFVFFAFEKFLPSASGLVESKVAAAVGKTEQHARRRAVATILDMCRVESCPIYSKGSKP
jgi:hypothetical protein